MNEPVSPDAIIETGRIEVHAYIGKGTSSFRLMFMEGAPADWVAEKVSQNLAEMIELARTKDAEIKASSQ